MAKADRTVFGISSPVIDAILSYENVALDRFVGSDEKWMDGYLQAIFDVVEYLADDIECTNECIEELARK